MDDLTPTFTGIDLGNNWCRRAFMQNNVSSTYVDHGSRRSESTVAFVRNQRLPGYKNKKAQIKQPRVNLNMKFKFETLANLNNEEMTQVELDWAQSFSPFFNTIYPLVAAHPIDWDFIQRLSIYKAGQLANNNNLSLIRETTALAIHYYFHRLIGRDLTKGTKSFLLIAVILKQKLLM